MKRLSDKRKLRYIIIVLRILGLIGFSVGVVSMIPSIITIGPPFVLSIPLILLNNIFGIVMIGLGGLFILITMYMDDYV